MPPKFIYFDVGNVLLHFSNRRSCQQIAELAGVDTECVWEAVFGSGLAWQAERGEIDSRQLHAAICAAMGRQLDFDALALAASEIFEVNYPIKPIVAQLALAGYRLGLLSNTNEMHWNYFSDGRYKLIPEAFEVHALSFRIGTMKPDPEIYRAAARLAGVAPEEMFFVDDVPENVAGARAVGVDAIVFQGAGHLARELRTRGVRFNY